MLFWLWGSARERKQKEKTEISPEKPRLAVCMKPTHTLPSSSYLQYVQAQGPPHTHTHTHTHTQRTGHEACTHMLYTSHPETSLKDTLGENPHHWKSHFFFSFFNSCWISHAFWSRMENQRDEHQARKSKTLCQSWQLSHQLTTAWGRAEKCNALSQITDGTNVCTDCRALKRCRTNKCIRKRPCDQQLSVSPKTEMGGVISLPNGADVLTWGCHLNLKHGVPTNQSIQNLPTFHTLWRPFNSSLRFKDQIWEIIHL